RRQALAVAAERELHEAGVEVRGVVRHHDAAAVVRDVRAALDDGVVERAVQLRLQERERSSRRRLREAREQDGLVLAGALVVALLLRSPPRARRPLRLAAHEGLELSDGATAEQ